MYLCEYVCLTVSDCLMIPESAVGGLIRLRLMFSSSSDSLDSCSLLSFVSVKKTVKSQDHHRDHNSDQDEMIF